MCVEGKQLSSEEFADKLDQISTTNGELALIIGSSYGLSNEIKQACDFRMSVSKMTLTHQMLRVWLVEIIYRCLSINNGGKYHK
jgi:23S rRNA (pseudouridine1915-N3)-methyltransferase